MSSILIFYNNETSPNGINLFGHAVNNVSFNYITVYFYGHDITV